MSLKYQTKNIVFIRIYSLLGRILKFLYELNIDTGDLENDIISVYNHFELFHTYEEFFKLDEPSLSPGMREAGHLAADLP